MTKYSHVYALPVEAVSTMPDASDLTVPHLRKLLLEFIYQLSDQELKSCLSICDTVEADSSQHGLSNIDQEALDHNYPLQNWFKAIDSGKTRDGLLQWQLEQERIDAELRPEMHN